MLRSRSLTLARSFLEKMALEGKKLLIHLYNQKVALADKEKLKFCLIFWPDRIIRAFS